MGCDPTTTTMGLPAVKLAENIVGKFVLTPATLIFEFRKITFAQCVDAFLGILEPLRVEVIWAKTSNKRYEYKCSIEIDHS